MPRRVLPASLILTLLLVAASTVHAQSGTADLAVSVRLQAKGNLPNRARIGDQVAFAFQGNGASGIFLNHSDGIVSAHIIANNAQWGMGRT
jgi:hypothetical protein